MELEDTEETSGDERRVNSDHSQLIDDARDSARAAYFSRVIPGILSAITIALFETTSPSVPIEGLLLAHLCP